MAASRNKTAADPQARLLAHLASCLLKDVPDHSTVTVGFSGGRDSAVLLDALSRLIPERLQAIHVHHGLSPLADQWAEFCQQFAQQRQIPCQIERVSVDVTGGQGLEGAAREARYAAFQRTGHSWVALAHHQNDQVETVMFRVLRGTGIHGLAGMQTVSARGGLTIWRPLLGLPRALLEAYASTIGLDWVEDESNNDRRYRRNFLRHQILPALEPQFAGFSPAVARLADHAAEAASLLDELARDDWRLCRSDDATGLKIHALAALSPARQRNVLRFWIKQLGLPMPETRTLHAWQAQLELANQVADWVWSYSAGEFRVWRGVLYPAGVSRSLEAVELDGAIFTRPGQCSVGTGSVSWEKYSGLEAGKEDLLLSTARLSEHFCQGASLSLSRRKGGETLRLSHNRPRQLLKKLLQASSLFPWERDRRPVLRVSDQVVGYFGIGVNAAFQPIDCDDAIRFSWQAVRPANLEDL